MSRTANQSPAAGRPPAITVAYVALGVDLQPRLDLGRESAEIQSQMLRAPRGHDIRVAVSWAARRDDLQAVLLHTRPTILHLSTHGLPAIDQTGPAHLRTHGRLGEHVDIPPHALEELIAGFADVVKAVVLSACHSEMLARQLARRIDCAIGMDGAITDEAAITFSTGFYRALAYGESHARSFALGCNAIDLAGLNEGRTPRLFTRHPAVQRRRLMPRS